MTHGNSTAIKCPACADQIGQTRVIMEAKQTIVRMTVADDSPVKFRGKFNTWCCPWRDVRDFVGELLEQDEAKDGKVTVSFEVIEIAGGFEGWCDENDVEIDD